MMRIAYQGEPGAYSEEAALKYFGADVNTYPCPSFDGVFAAVQSDVCEYGMVPIENSLAGNIERNYDLLYRHPVSIVGEHFLRIQHCLIAHPGVTLPELRHVISHPQGLAQCHSFLQTLPDVTTEAVYNTAGGVKMVREKGDRSVGAIASRRAAEIYGMEVLAEGIEDDPLNYTRFLLIAQNRVDPRENAKTSIAFKLPNLPGMLGKALSVFAVHEIDIIKIESHPLAGTLWDYVFFIDFIGSTSDPAVLRTLDALAEYSLSLRVFGSYPSHQLSARTLLDHDQINQRSAEVINYLAPEWV
jgi:prephenate dehydratase